MRPRSRVLSCEHQPNKGSLGGELIVEYRAVFFLFTLWWARKNWLTWTLIAGMVGLIVLFWFVAGGVALRYLVSCPLEMRTMQLTLRWPCAGSFHRCDELHVCTLGHR